MNINPNTPMAGKVNPQRTTTPKPRVMQPLSGKILPTGTPKTVNPKPIMSGLINPKNPPKKLSEKILNYIKGNKTKVIAASVGVTLASVATVLITKFKNKK